MGWPFVSHGALVGVIDLDRIVTAAAQVPDLVVGHVLDQLQQLGIFAEKFLADISAVHARGTSDIRRRRTSCMRLSSRPLESRASRSSQPDAPDHFDDVPARAAERRFQFLNDAAVAAHRPVQPLQVAVDHENQIVELLARCQRQRAQRFRLIAFRRRPETPKLCAAISG